MDFQRQGFPALGPANRPAPFAAKPWVRTLSPLLSMLSEMTFTVPLLTTCAWGLAPVHHSKLVEATVKHILSIRTTSGIPRPLDFRPVAGQQLLLKTPRKDLPHNPRTQFSNRTNLTPAGRHSTSSSFDIPKILIYVASRAHLSATSPSL